MSVYYVSKSNGHTYSVQLFQARWTLLVCGKNRIPKVSKMPKKDFTVKKTFIPAELIHSACYVSKEPCKDSFKNNHRTLKTCGRLKSNFKVTLITYVSLHSDGCLRPRIIPSASEPRSVLQYRHARSAG